MIDRIYIFITSNLYMKCYHNLTVSIIFNLSFISLDENFPEIYVQYNKAFKIYNIFISTFYYNNNKN